jgi:hypothetical protein
MARVFGALPPGLKWSDSEADYSFLSIVKTARNFAYAPSICLHGIYEDAFTFYFDN